jgi:murein DD-endopeptidase MepM/ murein hydrolase activator NlpD
LWNVGPVLLVILSTALLAVGLASSLRGGHAWSRRGAAGLVTVLLLVLLSAGFRTYPSSYDDRPSAVDFRLPLDGPVTVAWGGGALRVNHHVTTPEERWAYDLLVTADGVTHRRDGSALTDYYVYDRPVRAPAAGRVVAVQDGVPDAPPGRADRRGRGGNGVVLEVAPGQYLFLLHLRAGTIRVAAGQDVREGDVVGRVGSSGNSSEPHLHVHLQDTPEVGAGEGIPMYFAGYVVLNGGQKVRRGVPTGGMRDGRYTGQVITHDGAFSPGPSSPPGTAASRQGDTVARSVSSCRSLTPYDTGMDRGAKQSLSSQA